MMSAIRGLFRWNRHHERSEDQSGERVPVTIDVREWDADQQHRTNAARDESRVRWAEAQAAMMARQTREIGIDYDFEKVAQR